MGSGTSTIAGRLAAPGKFGRLSWLALAALCLLVTGCGAYTAAMKADMAANLSDAIVNSDDPATVAAAAPAYLVMTDGFLRGDPENAALLVSGARLYATYAGVFITEKRRAKVLTERALSYAERALCVRDAAFCSISEAGFDEFSGLLKKTDRDDLPALYVLGVAWGGWIEAHRDDLSAVAKISRIEAVMKRVVELDEGFEDGGAHLYLGVMATLLPPALGGKPEVGRRHFERALALSGGRNLMAKVLYAEKYARLMFDRPLHDRLLGEVLAEGGDAEGYRLVNLLAKEKAEALLAGADDYF